MIQKIRNLIINLPRKDQLLAESFINSRDFESLQELVDSAIIKVKRNLSSDNPKEDYINLDIDEMIKLKIEVDNYLEQLQLPNQEDDVFYDEEY